MRMVPTRREIRLALWLGALVPALLGPPMASAADRTARVVSQRGLTWHKTFASAQAEARRRDVPLVVHFHASWCGPCRRMERDVLDTKALATKLGTGVVAVKVDTDREPAVASGYRVRLLPTDLVLTPDGKELVRTQGYQGLRNYLARISPAVTRYRMSHPEKKTAGNRLSPGTPSGKRTDATKKTPPRLGLAGFSPVTLWTRTRWQRGDKKFACQVGREIYYLASARELEQFRRDPSRFVPRCEGHDVVRQVETGRSVAGSIRHAVFYDGGLYLFCDATTLARFRKSPARYAAAVSRSVSGNG